MNGRNTALAVIAAVALASVGAIVWALVPASKNEDASASDQSAVSVSQSEAESSAAESVTEQSESSDSSEAESITESAAESSAEGSSDTEKPAKRKFTVDVLLAPLGFRVEKDYELEIAPAADVKSKPSSRLDFQDNIIYSAAVINGVTELELENGDYEICIYPEGQPDNFKRYSWHIDEDTSNKALQLIVTEKVEPGQMMIVLHWGEKPRDIDGYLVGEGETVFYWGREGKHARLDTDSRKGSGIETITVTDTNGSFTYTVDDYSNETPLWQSGAVVEVFTSENRNPTVFRVPANIKEVWEVFKLENGQLTAINKEGGIICPEKIDGSWEENHNRVRE